MEIITTRKRVFYYNIIVARNGEIVFASETYFSRGNAKREGRKAAKALGIPHRVEN